MTRHVAVLMGGWSAEREISLKSGRACADALRQEGYRISELDVTPDIAQHLLDVRPDVVFNALHGPYGEDGTIQGLLEILKLPYTHSGVLASALAMDKEKAKVQLKAQGILVPHGVTASRFEAARSHLLPPPYVVKPVREGSSKGVILVKEGRSHPPQELLRPDWAYGENVLVETYIPGRELTCAVMGDRVFEVTEIIPVSETFYGYDAKYAKGGSKHVLPAKIKPKIYQEVQKWAQLSHMALGCRGVSRTDFRYDETAPDDSGLFVLEVNTQPGMTETSLVPELARFAGLSFGDLVRWMVGDASLNR